MRVVAGGVVDERVVAVELEALAAGPDTAAHAHRRLLAGPHPGAPVRRHHLDSLALIQLEIDGAIARSHPVAVERHAPAALEHRAVRQGDRPPPLRHSSHAATATHSIMSGRYTPT